MLISKQNRKLIYENLFREGVLVAKKDFNAARHKDINVPNLQVLKAMQSLESRGFIKSQFSWQWFYYTLTDSGIEYLRKFLNIPDEIVPATFKKVRAAPTRARPETTDARGPRPTGDRAEYRRADKKENGPSSTYNPEFRGAGRGIGRGASFSTEQ